MPGAADFGVGLASGAAVEVGKFILEFAREIRANKKSVNALAEYCDETTKHLESLIQDACSMGKLTPQVDTMLTRYMDDYKMTLGKIKGDMCKWKALNPNRKLWARIYHKRDIEADIATSRKKLADKSDRFKAREKLMSLGIAVSDKGIRTVNELNARFRQARMEDRQTDETQVENATKQLIILGHVDQALSYAVVQSGGNFTRLGATVDRIENKLDYTIEELQQKLEAETDPEFQAAAFRLAQALRDYGGVYPPEVLDIDSREVILYHRSPYRGSRSTVYKGSYQGQVVAIKQLKLDLENVDPADEKEALGNVFKRITREAGAWSKLSHPNIVKFLGYWKADEGQLTCLISLWAHNGDARQYIKHLCEACIESYERHRLYLLLDHSLGAAEGLRYLHGLPDPIIHAGLQGKHILVDATGNPMLTDFGISVLSVQEFTNSRPPDIKWTAPEILDAKALCATTASDVYSFGMTVLELFTARDPFHDLQAKIRNTYKLREQIMGGLRPGFPTNPECAGYELASEHSPIWCLLLRCWVEKSLDRPTMEVVWKELKQIYGR
ncbi:hypothetical protein FRB96_009654 [Tulasnella sp. 330]|nr:hypothetical protein FRB96_009654 [Tulasnella sp. 330]